MSSVDYWLFSNRALFYLKLGQPKKALDDCQVCLSMKPFYTTALHRKAWALDELVKSRSNYLAGHARTAAAIAIYFDSNLSYDKKFCLMFPEVHYREIHIEGHLAFVLMTAQGNETLLLHEGV